ncbi:MAG TPA: hypothetical protein G4O05_09455 [Caldilineae bacterium]|nr:hypothetical protein [Caldilineae bacterium]
MIRHPRLLLMMLLSLAMITAGLLGSPAPALADPGSHWPPPEPAFKILVDETGVYRLTYDDLASAGLPLDALDPRTLQLFNQAQEIAILVEGEQDGQFDRGDAIIFYGEAADTRYTDTNVYWLTYGHATGLRMTERDDQPQGALLTHAAAQARYHENYIYISNLPLNEKHDHWYGPSIQAAGQNNPKQRIITLALDALAPEQDGHLTGLFAGNVTGVHHLRILVNNVLIYDGSWEDRTLHQVDAPIPARALKEGDNQVQLVLLNDTPDQVFDMIYIDWVQIEYPRRLVARDGHLTFESPAGAWTYRIEGLTPSDASIFDITHPARVALLGASIEPNLPFTNYLPMMQTQGAIAPFGGIERRRAEILEFGDSGSSPRRYLVLDRGQFLTPKQILPDVPSHLTEHAQGADYILITHRDFWSQAQTLANYRAGQGLRVALVDVQDIYDEFNGGLMSSEAIRDFLAYAYAHWPSPAPRFVLLMGDGAYDMRHYLGDSAPTFIPPFLTHVDKFLGEVAADNRYVTVVGDDHLPDMAIGRFPVNTQAEAQRMVNKTIAYETQAASGDWRRHVLFVADDLEGGGGDFYALSDELADGYADPPANTIKFLPTSYDPIKVYLGETCDRDNPDVADECRDEIVNTLEGSGALLLNYIGHATKRYWAEERLLDQTALAALHTQGQWPITLAMSCVDGFFHESQQGVKSFAEANVLAAGGSIASWSATSLGLVNPHQMLEKGFFLAMFHDRLPTLGEVTRSAKLYVDENAPQGSSRYQEVIDAYILFGDPALKITLPVH